MASQKKTTSISSPKEKDIENSILAYLSMVNIFAWKVQSTGLFDPVSKRFRRSNNKYHIRGISDILGILEGGKMLAIEVKTPKTKNRTTDDQKFFLNEINRNGGIGFVATSIDDVRTQLKILQQHPNGY